MSPREFIAFYRWCAAHCLEVAPKFEDPGCKAVLFKSAGRSRRASSGRDKWHPASAVGSTVMDDAEMHDLVTVLMRLEDLKGMANEIGRYSPDDLGVAADAERIGPLRKMLASIRSWRSAPGK